MIGQRTGLPPRPGMDRDSKEWWGALGRHELVLQQCSACRAWRWPCRAICNRCASFDWQWSRPSGRGEVASWIVNHHRFSESWTSPYAVVTVRLAEQDDILIPGSFDGPIRALSMRLAVTAGFDDVDVPDGESFTLLTWRSTQRSPGPATGGSGDELEEETQ